MNRLAKLVRAVAVAATFLALPLAAQTDSVYTDDFQSYGTQKNPPGWVDTAIGSSTPVAGGLYKTWPDPTQGNKGTNIVFGSKSASGKADPNANPRIGHFSTYTTKTFAGSGRFEFSGRFLRTNTDSRIGLTFFSSYPEKDSYYLIGLWSQPSGKLTMQLYAFGGAVPTGTLDSNFSPDPNKWYRFLISADDSNGKTAIHAKFWLDTNPEPSAWNIDATDASAGRLTSGRIGIWAAVRGENYVDDLSAKSPVDHSAPVIKVLESGQPLAEGTRFNRAPSPEIVVTDDLTPAAQIVVTAQLDGQPFTSKTAVTGQGNHTLTVHAVDSVGNASDFTVHFYVDTIPPAVTVISPKDNSMTANDVTIALQVVDASLPYKVAATLDGAAFDITKPVTSEGKHTLAMTVTDDVGLSTVVPPVTFTIDKSDPQYVLKEGTNAFPPSGFVFDRDVTAHVDATDLTPVTVKLTLDGASYAENTPITVEGDHTITGTVADSVGHVVTIPPRAFTIDKSAPIVTITENDVPMVTYYDRAVKPVIKVTDFSNYTVNATIDGQPFTFGTTLSTEKKYTLAGTVTDAANHSTPFGPIVFYIDLSAPAVQLTANGNPFPAAGFVFDADVAANATITDLTPTKSAVTLDGQTVTLPLTISDEKPHKLTAVVTDSVNKSTTATADFVIDKTPPSVDVQESGTSLQDGRYFNRAVTPQIVVTDSTATTVAATLDGQPFTSGTAVSAEGKHTIAGSVTDAAHHKVDIGPVSFFIDTTKPVGVFKEGDADFPDGKSLNRDVTARVAVTDASPVTVTILLDGAPYVENTPITTEQSHTLSATLLDKAGNSNTVPPVTFRIDRTPPAVVLLANGSAFPADYTFGRDIAADVRVDDASPTTTKGTLDGNQITFPYTITTEGQHTISATATDAAGLSTTTPAIHFTLDKTPPAVTVLENGVEAVPNKVFGVDVTVTFIIDQGVSQRTAYPTLDGNPYVAGTAITAEGVHTIAGEVKSAAGLSTPIPQTVFTIDKTKPVVKLLNRDKDFPPSGFYFNSDVVPVVDCTDNLTHCTAKLMLNGAEVPNNTPITAEGAYTLVVSGKDEAGNETQLDPVTFTIDKTPPAVTVTSHTDGQILTEPTAVIAGGSDDAVSVTVNRVSADIDFNNHTYKTPSALPLLEGENVITVLGIDRAGNPGTKSVRIILDTRNPSLTVKAPAAGACITDADLVVSGTVNDPNISKVSVTAGTATVDNALDATKQAFSATFPAIAEGAQNIVVIATDTQGHRTQAQLSVFVDRGTPVIEVLESNAPFTAKVVNHPVALTLRATDRDPNVTLSATLDGTSSYVSGAIIGGEGAHRVDVVAADCAGHQAAVSIQFTIDVTAPVITSVIPANGSTIAAAPQDITGTISGEAVKVEIAGTNISATPATNGDFTLTGATFREGANSFTLRATDAAGNSSTLAYSFAVKSQAPKVDIYESGSLLENGRTFNRPVTPVVKSDDAEATITALLNGATYDGSPVRGDGNYTIEGRATDKLNHTGSASRTFTIDMTPPAVHITSPAPGDVPSTTVTVSGTAGDAVSVRVNNVPATLSNGNFTATGVPLDIGENAIIAAATDAAGNTGQDRIIVNVLGSGPGIIITEPPDLSLTNRPRIDVAGRVLSPTSDGYVTIGSARAAVDAVGDFRFNGYQLTEGENVISVSATGTNLQTATAQIHVTADFTPPALTVLASDQALLDNAQFPQTVTITLRATDNRGAVTTTLSLDGSAQTAPVTVSANGGHVLTATARDTAGNETRIDRTFFIGTTTAASQGCHIDSTDPVDGAVIGASTVKVAGRAPGAATVTVAGVNASVADSSFAASIDLPNEGSNSIQIQCADAGGLTATRTINLIRSTGNPSIDITSPGEGFTTGDAKVTVSGTISADVVSADVNGKAVTISGTTFTVADIGLANGLNTLVAHAKNKAGRAAADSVRVRSIQTAPDIAITSPLNDYQTGDTKVTVSGTWSNLDPQTIAISGQSGAAPQVQVTRLSDTTGNFTITGAGLATGVNTLTITGRNALNVTATSTVKVTVTENTPSIAIASPADNAYLPGDQPITVTGSFNGTGAHIDINSNVATITDSSYSGSASFSTAGDVTPLVARLTDANGNSAFASVSVHRLNAPFAVKEAFPAPDAQEVDPGVIVLISFNAPVDMATVAGAVSLKASDGTTVTGMMLVDDTVLTFAPTSLLRTGTTYTLSVATSLKNAAGIALASAFSSSFTTASSAPSTPPSIDPITSVDCAKPLLITGTAPAGARLRMDAATLTLTGNADANGRFSFTYPFNGQSGWQVARVRIVGADGSLSPAAEVSFRFDCAAPQVVGASYDRTVNTLTISFSKPVDPATLVVGTGGSILITSNSGNTSAGTFSVSGSNVVVTPADDLRTATFTLTVTDSVKDAGGNKLIAPYSQTFSTADDLPPAPGDGSGFISGEVYDASTGRPLPGANVTIIVPATAFAKPPGTDSRYTIVGTPGPSSSTASAKSKKVNSNSLQVAVNSSTESRGRYTLPLPEGAHTIQATANGYTSVWRQIVVPAGAGVVPIDIRLTKRGDVKTSDGASPISLASGGDTLITRAVSATIPAGAVSSGSQAALTAVGAQSLAGLLPLGWSPLASAEVAVLDSTGAVLPHASLGSNAQIVFTLPASEVTAANQVLSLAQYDDDRDEWRVLVPVMTAGSNDKWSATVTTSGAYAVVYPDKAAGLAQPPAAQGGATLQPAANTCAPCELVKKSFDADPKTILPNGRTVATLQIINGPNTKFPSGTAVQAYVNEELHLPGGTTLVDPPFATDVLLYRNLAGDIGFGQFHLAPSAQATKVVLSDGVDHIQILQYPGRLDRGTLIGAEGGRVPGDESVAVEIPSSATTVELHASVSSLAAADLASYGTIAGFRIVGGFSLTMSRAQTPAPQDLDGDGQPDAIPPVTLSRAARATVAIDTAQLPSPSSLVILAEVVDDAVWGRIIRLADPMSAIDAPQAGVTTIRYTTRSIDPAQLPVDGVIREGKYLILAANDPIAYATGAVRGGAGGAYLADARLTSFTQPANALLGVADTTRNTGVFAIPVAATPAAGFALLPKHANTGEGTLINSTSAPAPDTIVKLGDVILTPQSPTLVSTSPAAGATVDVSAPLVITMNFSAPIDLATAKTAISVSNVTDGTRLSGTVNGSGNTVTFNPVGALVAASHYIVSIQPTLRGTNGAALQSEIAFGFTTNTIPTNQTIDPLKVHITIPDNGVSRIWGEVGAVPGGWRVLPVRQVSDFITRYQTDVAADGSFSLLAGNGVDASDRITIDDVIDLRVINPAGNVAAVIRLTPFVTPDGKGFVAPFGVTTTFKSVEGIVVTVPAGAFDEPTLINVGMNANNAVFNDVPNVANEVNLVRSINIKFDGVAKQRIEVSIPANGLPTDRDYTLGWHGMSVWGPRIAVVDTLRLDGNNFTTAYPTDQQVKKIIASANAAGGARVASNAGLTDMQIKSCLVGVTRQGDYAMMDWTMYVGNSLGMAIIGEMAKSVEVMSDLFQAIYLPDFAFSSRNNCAAMPVIKEKPFTLTGVDPSTGIVQFKTSYDPIPAGAPAVVPISSPDPDNRGPYPMFGTPFRIETIDFTADKYEGRGYKLELDASGKPHHIFLRPIATVPDDQKIAEHAKIQIYDATTSRWSSDTTEVDASGQFAESSVEGDRGDQLLVYISSSDVGVDAQMYVVFTEPIDVGPIASTSTTPEAKAHDADVNLHKRIKIERIVNSSPTEVTKDATFSVDSQNRRVWVSFPAPLVAGATYRMTFFGDLTHGSDQLKDPKGNILGILKDNSGNIVGDVGRDLKLEFKVRDNYDKTLTSFLLQARPDYTSSALRDLAQSGNLAFASALDAGLLVYDLSDPNSLRKDKSGNQPNPYSLIPARWTVPDPVTGYVKTLSGANGFDQYWAVTTDQHNRVFGAGFQSTLAAVRIYNVEDFVKAHNDNNGSQCTGFISFSGADAAPDNLKVANCQFHGATIVGWRPGYEANMPLSSGLVMTDYPEAYPRKIQIATQDNTKKYDDFDTLKSTTTQTADKVFVEAPTELGDTAQTPHTDNWRFNVRIKAAVPITPTMSTADKSGYLVERITIVNTDLDLRWSVDKYLGEDAVITGVIGRKKDHFQILRNQLTYSVITMLGYGISVYDMRAVQSNDIGNTCAFDAAFGTAHADFCSIVVAGHPRLLEKILNTRGDGVCDGTPTPNYDPAAIQNVTFSAESAGITPAEKDSSGNTVYTHLRMYGLDPRKGVLDLNYALPTDGSQPVAKCATRPVKGLVFADVQRLAEVRNAVHGASPRYNAQTLFHWEITAADNVRGERGSEPKKAASRDYSLIAAGVYGLLVVEINGNPAPPGGPSSYSPLEQGHLADIIWFASGCYAIRPIPKTNLVTVLDGKGHVLVVDLSKIDQRWVDPNPNLATGGAAPMIGEFDPFPITHTAITGTPVNAGEIGVDDARVIYKSPYVYTTGVIAPLVDPDTGIAFGGDSVTRDMRVAELFDPPMEVLADLGNGKLEPVTGVVPLGVQPPPKDPTKKPTDPGYNYPKGALAAFKVRVTLPGSISKALQNSQLQFAIESESFPNELTAQTPVGTPPAHLRHNKRDGTDETRKVDLVFKHESDFDPSSSTYDADFRHQAGYNRLVSPWIVAIADPRASEHVKGDSAAKKKLGCISCDRPDALHGVDENNGVYELFTNGRTFTVRPDADKDSTKEKDALNGLDTVNGHQYDNVNGTSSPSVYFYLADKGRLELHVPTTIADTVRGEDLTVSAQAPPVADGAISETMYVHSGEIEVNSTDLVIPGRAGNDVAVARTHRSRTIGTTPIGMGWEAPFLRRLRQLPTGNVEYRDGQGEIWTFTPITTVSTTATTASATSAIEQQFGLRVRYNSPKGLYLKLARSDNGWILFDRQWRIARFDNYGRVTSISDEFWKDAPPPGSTPPPGPGAPPPTGELGNSTFYVYDHTGRLTEIVDSLGRKTELTYWKKPKPSDPPPVEKYDCTTLGTRTVPCAYDGLLATITDWRSRQVIFEYDKNARLIGVQRPLVEGPEAAGFNASTITATTNFSAANTRPRVSYTYDSPAAPAATEPLQSLTYTNFMYLSGKLHELFDAAENAPSVTSPHARVSFDYYEDFSTPETYDRLHFQHWPCGDYDGSNCSQTDGKFEFSGDTTTVTDMLGQKRDYQIADLKEPAASGTDPDPQKNKFKHVVKETAYDVPTIDKTLADTLGVNDPTPGKPFITTYVASGVTAPYYDAFDDEGGVKDMTLPNGLTVNYETEKAHNGAAGLILKKITEQLGADKRVTQYTYDNNHPNAANTVIRIGRSKDGTTFVERDAQSPSRELKNTQSRDTDPKVQTKTEANYDDYGRATSVERRQETGSSLNFPTTAGSGLVVEQHKIDYFDDPNDADLSKGRVKEVHSDDPGGSSTSALDTTITYADANTNGQKITAVDQRRYVTTETEHDSQDRVIHQKVYDTNTLSESWTGYDASGRVVYTAHSQAPAYDRVESFIKYDAVGRAYEVRTTSNKVFGSDQDITVRKQYSISSHTTTTFDPTTSLGSPQAKTVITVDNLGRTTSTERQMLVVPALPAVQQSEISKFGYDSTGLLAYTTDTVRSASFSMHDAFGRASISFGIDKLQVKPTYDEWDQVIEQEAKGASGTSLSHAKQKFSHAGHLISRNEQVDSPGLASNLRFRQTFNIWEDGGKKTGVRHGPATGLDADLVGPHIRATQQENDGTGRVLAEVYGAATGTDPGIAPELHRRKFEEYVGNVAQKVTDISPLRSNASVMTKVTVDGLDRVLSSTVGNTYTTTTDYDLAGNVSTVTPPQGVGTIHRDYDGRGLPFHEKRNNDDITNTYDERGALRSYQDETGAANTTNYNVDPLGRVVKVTYPDSTTEEFKYEDKTGLTLAHKDRKNVWLSYVYDEGGRTTQIRKGEDPTSGASVLMTRFEYDNESKRLTRVANKDAAIEFRKYDDLGRAGETVTYRYSGGTGLTVDPAARTVLDVHIQGHAWSVFDGERLSWRFPVTGDAVGALNAAPWLTEITENRDESTNLISQLAGSGTLTESTSAGVGQLLDRFRTVGSQAIRSQYAYADTFLASALGDPSEPQFGALRRVETGIASGSGASMTTGPAIAGSEVFHDNTSRIGQINDLGLSGRKSKYTYDSRGRIYTSKLLVPQSALATITPVTDEHNPATFHNERDTAASLITSDINKLGVPLALQAEPARWTAAEGSAHQIQSKTLYLDGQPVQPDMKLPTPGMPLSPTFTFAYEGGRRTSDGTWNSTFDEFGRMTSIENGDRRIEYVYDPRGRIVGRNAYEKPAGGGTPVIETRATALVGDGLPAQTTWVWDPVVDRLVAVYEAGKSTAAGATPEAGLVRQYLHGDRGYDDPVEVLVAKQSGATPTKYFPIFDEAGAGSLQAVLDANGNVVERVLYGDSYGDAPHYVQGPAVDKVTFTPNNDGSVDVRVHANERIKQMTVTSGVSLVALKSDDSVAATSTANPSLDSDEVTIHWHLSGTEWTALTSSGAVKLQVSVKSSLRTYSWGDTAFSAVPDFARKLYTAKSDANLPVIVTSLLSTLAAVPNGTDEPLYEIKSLYMAGFDYSKTKLLTGFHALPFNEPANGLIFARARWYDPSTGSFLTPDPIGYHDASSLYAFAAGDPVNGRDPSGLTGESDLKDTRDFIAAKRRAEEAKRAAEELRQATEARAQFREYAAKWRAAKRAAGESFTADTQSYRFGFSGYYLDAIGNLRYTHDNTDPPYESDMQEVVDTAFLIAGGKAVKAAWETRGLLGALDAGVGEIIGVNPSTPIKLAKMVKKSLAEELKMLRQVQGAEGMVGVAETDLPGLEEKIFRGASPKAGGPLGAGGSISSPNPNALFRKHAEEDLANQIDTAIQEARLSQEQMTNKTVDMLIEERVCNICRQGLGGTSVPPGVLRQVSLKYPGITFKVTNQVTHEVLQFRGGKFVN